jgi:hypothetical protein
MTRRRSKGGAGGAQRVQTPAAAAREREASAAALVMAAADDAGLGGGSAAAGPPRDLSRLRKLAAVRGLATDALRARLWPLLVGAAPGAGTEGGCADPPPCPAAADDPLPALLALPPLLLRGRGSDPGGDGSSPRSAATSPDPELQAYLRAATQTSFEPRDAAVVACDVERSLWRLCPDDAERPAMRAALARVLRALLVTEGEAGGGGGAGQAIGDKAEEAAGREEEASKSAAAAAAGNGSGAARQQPQPPPEQQPDGAAPTGPSNNNNDDDNNNDGPVRYYQGLHDVASVLLVVTRDELASYRVLRSLCRAHLRDATRPSLDAVVETLTLALPPVVRAADPELARCLESARLPPFYALSWLITWFSHDVRDAAEAARLFDLFLSAHPLMPLYVGAAAMRAQRDRLLGAYRKGEREGEAMPRLHTALVNLDALACPGGADRLACEAIALFALLPPGEAVRLGEAEAAAAAARGGRGGGGRARPASAASPLRLAVAPRAYLSAPGGVWRVPALQQQQQQQGRPLLGSWTSRQAARLATGAAAPSAELARRRRRTTTTTTMQGPDGGAGAGATTQTALLLLLDRTPLLRPVGALAMSGIVLIAAVLAALTGGGASRGAGGGGGGALLDAVRQLLVP